MLGISLARSHTGEQGSEPIRVHARTGARPPLLRWENVGASALVPLPPLEADVLGTGTEVGESTDTALGRLRGPLLLADWHRLVAACLAAAGCAGLALALAAGTVPARLRLLSGTGGVPKGGGGGATSGNAVSPRNAALMQAGLTAPPTWLLPLMAYIYIFIFLFIYTSVVGHAS